MKTVIITGAGGFIGGALTRRLLSMGNSVWGVDINPALFKEFSGYGDFHPVIADFSQYDKLSEELPRGADVFYHLAWDGNATRNYNDIEIQRKNFNLSSFAVEAAIKADCQKFVFVGTSHENLVGINSIDGKKTNGNIYGVSKKCARIFCEFMCKDKMRFNSTAFTNVFGVGDYSRRTTNTFIKKMLAGEPLNLVPGDNPYDWIYVDDAVEGLIAVGFKGKNAKQYYIGNRQTRAFKDIIKDVRDIVNPNAELFFGTYSDNTYIDYSKFDLNALYEDTGFECKADFRESILKTAEWVKGLNWQ